MKVIFSAREVTFDEEFRLVHSDKSRSMWINLGSDALLEINDYDAVLMAKAILDELGIDDLSLINMIEDEQ